MSDFIEIPEKIVLAGDMALHWGVALVSTKDGVIASMHFSVDAQSKYRDQSPGQIGMITTKKIIRFVKENLPAGKSIAESIFEQPTPQNHKSAIVQIGMIAAFNCAAAALSIPESKTAAWPVTIKKWATGVHNAPKPEMTARANELLPAGYRTIRDHNEADAVLLGLWYAEMVVARETNAIAWRLQREAEAEADS